MSGTKWKLTVGHMIGFLILAALVQRGVSLYSRPH